MRVIVGLGNPGSKYAFNRHNIGFLAVDEIHRRNSSFGPWRNRFQAETSEGTLAGEKILLVKPTTYMNESGRSVGEILRFFKLSPDDILVIYDEIDLPPAKFRMKSGGGHGGHNGLRSLSAHIGDAYHRLRLGVGHPGRKDLVSGYVLHDFAKADRVWLDPLLEEIGRQAGMLATGQYSQFANKMHLTLSPEKDRNRPAKKSERNTPAGSAPAHTKPGGPTTDGKEKKSAKGPLAAGLERLLGWKKDET